jgi:hypothetical protein
MELSRTIEIRSPRNLAMFSPRRSVAGAAGRPVLAAARTSLMWPLISAVDRAVWVVVEREESPDELGRVVGPSLKAP